MSGGGSKNTTQTTKVEYSPEEQAARNKVMQAALGTYDTAVANNDGIYKGAKPVGMGSTTQLGSQMLIDNAHQQQGQIAQTQAANNFALSDALYAESNPYLQSAIGAATRPLIESFSESGGALQGIRNGAQSAGGYGGSRQGIAEGIAAKGLINKTGDIASTMANQNYQQGLEAQQSAIRNQAMLTMLSQMPGQTVGQVGAMEDANAQAQENYAANQRQYASTAQWEPLQNMANIIYGGSNGTTTSTAQGPSQDNTMATIGSVGSMAMMAAMMY